MNHDLKAIAWRWVEAAVGGDAEGLRALFAPDCRLFVAGDMPFSGWMGVDAFFAQTSVLPLDGLITFDVGDMVAEGDRIWFEAQSEATLRGGVEYRNYYIFQLRIADGLIAEYKEFADTLHIWRSIDDPRTRGAPIHRQKFVRWVARRLVGNAIAGSAKD